MRRALTAAILAAALLAATGCGDDTDTKPEAKPDEATSLPDCEDVASGDAALPPSLKCVDDEPSEAESLPDCEDVESGEATLPSSGECLDDEPSGSEIVGMCADVTGQDTASTGEPVPGFVACLKRLGAPPDVIAAWGG